MPSSDELRGAYEDVVDPLYEEERDARYATFRRVVRRLGPGDGRYLLDVGAYCGYFLDVARDAGFVAEGLELSSWAAACARALGVVVHEQTLADLASTGKQYSVITMWDVIEHMRDPRAELEAACQLLTPGGHLYLSTIDTGSLLARALGRRWPWLMDMHLYYFSRSNIRVALEQAGFEVLNVRRYTHIVSMSYLARKVRASIGDGQGRATGRPSRISSRISSRIRIPVQVGDNMMVVARRVE